jgi:hypothetical protein
MALKDPYHFAAQVKYDCRNCTDRTYTETLHHSHAEGIFMDWIGLLVCHTWLLPKYNKDVQYGISQTDKFFELFVLVDNYKILNVFRFNVCGIKNIM